MTDDASRDWKLPWTGECRCGRVKVIVSAPPLLTAACHCRGCQRMTASAFSLSLGIPEQGFAVTGELVPGGLHGEARHMHCAFCMSWVYTTAPIMQGFVNLRATMLDDAGWFEPYVEFVTKERLPWARTPAMHSFEDVPPYDAFGPLLAEYAEKGARPR